MVKPSDFNQSVILRRKVESRYFKDTINGSSFWYKSPDKDDTSYSPDRDDDPQSGGSNGVVYDWDAPGIGFEDEFFGTIIRARSNFKQYAVYNDDGTNIRCSLIYNWYCVRSGKKTGPKRIDWSQENSITNDNKVVFGNQDPIPMTWDIGHPTITGITPNSGDNKNQYLFVTITGNGFAYGADVFLKRDQKRLGIPASGITVFSPTKITCYFSLIWESVGQYNVIVTNPEDDVNGELANGFTITPPKPKN